MDVVTLQLAKQYADAAVAGAGAIKGDKGDKGDPGPQGPAGPPGPAGEDGYSPTIETTTITGGHRVTITDADGTQSFDVMDGKDGTGGGGTYLVNAPIGTIVIWSGTKENIPDGWALCDGQEGRPDLRDKFVLGAGTAHAIGSTGGSEEVTLTIAQMPSHNHSIASGTTAGGSSYGAIAKSGQGTNVKTSNTPSSATEGHNNMPPYYTLCYIIKVTADETDGVTMDQVNAAIDAKLEDVSPHEAYSTEETRIGTWIDGKPIYRVCQIATSGESIGTYVTIPNVSKDVDTYVKGTGIVHGVILYNKQVDLPFNIYIRLVKIDGTIKLLANDSDYTKKTCIVIVEYTKTTDTAPTQ